MTDERYAWWKSTIADARADNNRERLAVLQLDYNLELGECLAHQSGRTKDIKKDLETVTGDVRALNKTVSGFDVKLERIDGKVSSDKETIQQLTSTVKNMVDSHRDKEMQIKGAQRLYGSVKALAYGAVTLIGWAYAIYQAVRG